MAITSTSIVTQNSSNVRFLVGRVLGRAQNPDEVSDMNQLLASTAARRGSNLHTAIVPPPSNPRDVYVRFHNISNRVENNNVGMADELRGTFFFRRENVSPNRALENLRSDAPDGLDRSFVESASTEAMNLISNFRNFSARLLEERLANPSLPFSTSLRGGNSVDTILRSNTDNLSEALRVNLGEISRIVDNEELAFQTRSNNIVMGRIRPILLYYIRYVSDNTRLVSSYDTLVSMSYRFRNEGSAYIFSLFEFVGLQNLHVFLAMMGQDVQLWMTNPVLVGIATIRILFTLRRAIRLIEISNRYVRLFRDTFEGLYRPTQLRLIQPETLSASRHVTGTSFLELTGRTARILTDWVPIHRNINIILTRGAEILNLSVDTVVTGFRVGVAIVTLSGVVIGVYYLGRGVISIGGGFVSITSTRPPLTISEAQTLVNVLPATQVIETVTEVVTPVYRMLQSQLLDYTRAIINNDLFVNDPTDLTSDFASFYNDLRANRFVIYGVMSDILKYARDRASQ